MRKVSTIFLWAFITALILSVLVGIAATILQFVFGNIAEGFSVLLWTCISGWVLFATLGVKTYEKGERELI